MALTRVTESFYATPEYDGTHTRAVLIADNLNAELLNDDATIMSMTLDGQTHNIPTGYRLIVRNDGINPMQPQHTPDADVDYPTRFFELVGPPTVRHGKAAVGPLLLGTSTTVAVPLSSAMPSADYAADAVVWTGASLLGDLEVTDVVVVNASTVNVTVHNTGLVTLSGAILVTAVG